MSRSSRSSRNQTGGQYVMVRAVHLRVLPETRAECRGGERPCPLVSCRYHLLLNVTSDGRMYSQRELEQVGTIRIGESSFPDFSIDSIVDSLREMEETCALDVAERGSHTLEEVGSLLGIPRERVFEWEQKSQEKVAVLLADQHPDDPYFRLMAEQELKKQ